MLETEVFDLVGVGFGPANLALAIALRESQDAQEYKLRYTFVEKQANFGWHSSLLLPGSQLQVSPLKDLATMRDPTSSYTFFNYLHQQGRLAAFINRKASVPSRKEWSAYLRWAAKRMEDAVEYSQEVIQVKADQKDDDNDRIKLLKITTRDVKSGHFTVRKARNITIGVGGVPRLPTPFQHASISNLQNTKEQYIVHSSSFLVSLASLEPILREREKGRIASMTKSSSSSSSSSSSMFTCLSKYSNSWPSPLRFAVIGGGQSSAEMCLHLLKTFPNSTVELIFRASALVPSDDSAFVNSAAFDPQQTDVFWKANAVDRKKWTEEYKRTNYSVIQTDVLNEINNLLYEQEVELDLPWQNADGMSKFGKLSIRPNTEVEKVELVMDSNDISIRLFTTHTKQIRQETQSIFDAVFLGTGFERQPSVFSFLKPLSPFFPLLDENSKQKKQELGFIDEEECKTVLCEMMDSGDEYAIERLRQRTRGIARDYRLVNYWSDAFTHPAIRRDIFLEGGEGGESGSSSPTTRTSTASSSQSSETTLASSSNISSRNTTFEPSVFFLGGNEQTHGLSDSLFSIVAHRAGELCETIIKSHSTPSPLDSQEIKDCLQKIPLNPLAKVSIESLEGELQKLQTA